MAEVFFAIRKGDLKKVQSLVEQGIDKEDIHGVNSPSIHVTANYGHLEIVKYLVQQGAYKEAFDCWDRTPLYCAAGNGWLEMVRDLVGQGADSSFKNVFNGWTPLHAAAAGGYYMEIVEYMLNQGADRDQPSNHNNNGKNIALHLAALNGRLEVVQCLMSYGADINAKDKKGKTALDVASTEEIKQAIRDVEQQRYAANFGKKRIPEADLRPAAPPSMEAEVEEGEDEEEEDESSGGDENDEKDEEDK